MSVTITNVSIDPATLPYPFSVVLAGLGAVIYDGTPDDVLALCPDIQNGFRLTEGTVEGAPALPSFPAGDDPLPVLVFTFDDSGAVTSQKPADGLALTAAAFSHPSGGTFNFQLNGADKPTNYTATAQGQGGIIAQAFKFTANKVGVITARPSAASGRVDDDGTLLAGLGASVEQISTGVYEVTMDVECDVAATASLMGDPALHGITVKPVDVGIFRVLTFLLTDASPVDAQFSFTAQSVDPAVQLFKQDYSGTVTVYALS